MRGSAGQEKKITDQWDAQMEALGAFIRSQRKLANLSLRQLAELSSLSNPYLSQLERGMHQPSVRVLKLLSGALNVSAEMLLAQAGLLDALPDAVRAEAANSGAASPDTASASTAHGHSADAAAASTQAPPLPASVEEAIGADERLDDQEKAALLAVYRSMLRP
jgi:transcriptional regulator with XRE-family HTH domain